MKTDVTSTRFGNCQPTQKWMTAAIYPLLSLTAVLTILAAALILPTPTPQRIYCPDRLPAIRCQPYPPIL